MTGAEGFSYMVEASDEMTARAYGRRAMMIEGRTPGTILHVDRDPDGSELWEVVLTERPLRRGERLLEDGRRVSTGGVRGDARMLTEDEEWERGR